MIKVIEGTIIDFPKFFVTPTKEQLNNAITNLQSLHHKDRDIETNIQCLIKEYLKLTIELECGNNINELSGKDKDRIWFRGYQELLLQIKWRNRP